MNKYWCLIDPIYIDTTQTPAEAATETHTDKRKVRSVDDLDATQSSGQWELVRHHRLASPDLLVPTNTTATRFSQEDRRVLINKLIEKKRTGRGSGSENVETDVGRATTNDITTLDAVAAKFEVSMEKRPAVMIQNENRRPSQGKDNRGRSPARSTSLSRRRNVSLTRDAEEYTSSHINRATVFLR
jgi:hypothetical protein